MVQQLHEYNAHSATPPSFAYMSYPALDSSLCRAAAPRLCLCSPIVSASAAAPRLHPLQLLLPDCVRFCCCSPLASIRFNCYSPIASASAAARHLRPLQLLFPDCVRFSCSRNASASTAAPGLHPLRLLHPDCVCL